MHAVSPCRHHRFVDAILDPHRPPGLARKRDRQRLHLRIRLRAETASEVRDDHADVRQRNREQVGELCTD